MKCSTLACARKAAESWAVCKDCRDRILYGHIPQKTERRDGLLEAEAREMWGK